MEIKYIIFSLIFISLIFIDCTRNNLYSLSEDLIYTPVSNYKGWIPTEIETLTDINIYRATKGLTPFKPEALLYRIAKDRVLTIKEESHYGVGIYFEQMTKNEFTNVNELLGFNYTSVANVVEAWKKSELHNKLLLSNNEYCSIAYENVIWVAFICNQ